MKNEIIFKNNNQSPWLINIYNKYFSTKTDGFLVEIGIGHTDRCSSNTNDLMDLGWSGIYIDPVEDFCEELKRVQKNNLDRLTIINIGASDKFENNKIMYQGESLIPNNIKRTVMYKNMDNITCEPTTIILDKANCPTNFDLLSIDVEGYEKYVLNGLDFKKYCPFMLIIETNHYDFNELSKYIPDNYILIQRDYLNACYINGD